MFIKENTGRAATIYEEDKHRIRTVKQYEDMFIQANFVIREHDDQKYPDADDDYEMCVCSMWVLSPKLEQIKSQEKVKAPRPKKVEPNKVKPEPSQIPTPKSLRADIQYRK